MLATVLELFFDCMPADVPIENYPFGMSQIKSQLEKKEIQLKRFEKGEESSWVFWNLGPRISEADLEGRPKDKMILFTFEPPTVQQALFDVNMQSHFGKIFTWDDDLVDNKRFFKFYYPVLTQKMENLPPFEKKKFCTMIARRLDSKYHKELYKERESVIRFFEKKQGEFDLYGSNWEKRKFKNWKGAVVDKMAVLKDYKYCICYENTRDVKGYITEKIFDCFAAGVVPVYWGASNVTDYIPKECFIDRRQFKNNKEMYKFLSGIKREEYEKYLSAAEKFLKSEKAQAFTTENFVKTFMSAF